MNDNGGYNDSVSERDSIKNLLAHLASQFTTVVRGEIALTIQSLRERISDSRNGLILIVLALLVGLVALISLSAAVVIKLFETMSPAGAACTVGIILLLISVLLVCLGYWKIKSSIH